MPEPKLIIRTSDRGTFKRCRQLWDFTSKIRMDYAPLRPAHYFEFGTAWHAAMEVWYAPESELLPYTFLESPERAGHACLRFAQTNLNQKRSLEELGYGGPDLDLEYKEREDLGLGMLNYFFPWSREHDATMEPVTVEHEFEVEIGHHHSPGVILPPGSCACPPISYQGRIDGLVKSLNTGKYWILEHKTASKESSDRWLLMDDQTGSYIWALQKMLGAEIEGVIRTTAYKRFPTPPRILKDGSVSVDKRQATTAALFQAAVQEAYPFQPVAATIATVEKYQAYHDFLQNPDVAPKFVERHSLERNHAVVEDIGRRIALEAEDMLNEPNIYPNVTPMNCNGCGFFEPCMTRQEGGDWQFQLESEFRKRS